MVKYFIEQVILFEMNKNGLIHYRGRKDHQIKLHGQRIELGERLKDVYLRQQFLACVVIKWDDDHLDCIC